MILPVITLGLHVQSAIVMALARPHTLRPPSNGAGSSGTAVGDLQLVRIDLKV